MSRRGCAAFCQPKFSFVFGRQCCMLDGLNVGARGNAPKTKISVRFPAPLRGGEKTRKRGGTVVVRRATLGFRGGGKADVGRMPYAPTPPPIRLRFATPRQESC